MFSYTHIYVVPTGLLALQGEDELGRFIRKHLKELGVRTDFIEGILDHFCRCTLSLNLYICFRDENNSLSSDIF